MVKTSDKFAVWLATGRIFSMLATFVMPIVLTRCLTQSDYGVFSQFITLYNVLFVMFAFGFQTNLFYFYPESDREKRNAVVGNTLLLLCLSGLVFGGIFLLPSIQELIFGDSELSNFKYLVIGCVIISTPLDIVSPLFSVREDRIGAVLFPALFALCRIATVVLLGVLFHDIEIIMYGMLAYQIIMTLLTIIYCYRGDSPTLNRRLLKNQLRYCVPFGIAVTLQLLSNYFDKIVSVSLLTPATYAIYSVAFLSIPGVNQLYESLSQVNIINMSKCHVAGETDRILPLYRGFVQKTLSFSSPLIIVAALYADEIIGFLFTAEYAPAADYFRIYTVTFLVSMFGAGTILRSIDKTKLTMYAFAITCIIGLPLTYFLIRHYGIDGAIISALVNMMLPKIIQMFFEMHELGVSLSDYLPWKSIALIWGTSLLYLVPLALLKYFFHTPLWLCMCLSVIYIISVYSVLINKNEFVVSKKFISDKFLSFKAKCLR